MVGLWILGCCISSLVEASLPTTGLVQGVFAPSMAAPGLAACPCFLTTLDRPHEGQGG